MRQSTKILSLIGLGGYGTGLALSFFNGVVSFISVFPKDAAFEVHFRYFINSFLLEALGIIIQILISAVLGFFAYKFFKKPMRKRAIGLSIVSGAIFLFYLVFSVLSVIPAIPKYLIYSKLGIVDTYITYILSLLENGSLLMIFGALVIFLGALIEIFSKRKQNTDEA